MGKKGIKQISTPDDLALSKASPLLWATRSTLAADLLQHQPRCQGALEAASICSSTRLRHSSCRGWQWGCQPQINPSQWTPFPVKTGKKALDHQDFTEPTAPQKYMLTCTYPYLLTHKLLRISGVTFWVPGNKTLAKLLASAVEDILQASVVLCLNPFFSTFVSKTCITLKAVLWTPTL